MFKYIIVELTGIRREDLPTGLRYLYFKPVGPVLFLAFEDPEEVAKAKELADRRSKVFSSYTIESKKIDPFEIPSERLYLEHYKTGGFI
jgi:hypothetical protein